MKKRIKNLIITIKLLVNRHPLLKQTILNIANRSMMLEKLLRQIKNTGEYQNTPKKLVQLTPNAQKIYSQLKENMKKHEKSECQQ